MNVQYDCVGPVWEAISRFSSKMAHSENENVVLIVIITYEPLLEKTSVSDQV